MKRVVLQESVKNLKRSDPEYLKARFELLQSKGFDKVRNQNIHGSNSEIEHETLRIMRSNKKRFNQSLERRNEFSQANYLATLMANEQAAICEETLRN